MLIRIKYNSLPYLLIPSQSGIKLNRKYFTTYNTMVIFCKCHVHYVCASLQDLQICSLKVWNGISYCIDCWRTIKTKCILTHQYTGQSLNDLYKWRSVSIKKNYTLSHCYLYHLYNLSANVSITFESGDQHAHSMVTIILLQLMKEREHIPRLHRWFG